MPKNKNNKIRKTNKNVPNITSRIKGSGDYSEDIKSIMKPLPRLEAKLDHLEKSLNKTNGNIASSLGRTLGNFVNQGDLGALAGESLSKYFGKGDYTVKSNSLIKGSSSSLPPKFQNQDRSVRVTEREYIGDVLSAPALVGGSSVFLNTVFPINPRDPVTFPWLSKFSTLYDLWEPHGIVFEFVSTSSEFNGTSQALGTVVMATSYDPYEPQYVNKQQMENSDFSCVTKPSLSLVHGVECDPDERAMKVLYLNSTNPTIPITNKVLANFQLATQGCSTTGATLGELWVSYDISFYRKLLDPTNTPLYIQPYLQVSSDYHKPVFEVPTNETGSGITYTISDLGKLVIHFNNDNISRKYLFNQFWANVGATYNNLTSLTFANCFMNTPYVGVENDNGILTVIYITPTDLNATITITGPSTGAPDTSNYNFYFYQAPDGLFY